MEFEFNAWAAAVTIILSMIFGGIIFGMQTWDVFPMKFKIVIMVVFAPISYFIALWKIEG